MSGSRQAEELFWYDPAPPHPAQGLPEEPSFYVVWSSRETSIFSVKRQLFSTDSSSRNSHDQDIRSDDENSI